MLQEGQAAPELYHIVQEQAATSAQTRGQLYGSEKTYVLPGSGVEMTMNPDELEAEMGGLKGGQEALRDAYEAQLADRGGEEGGAEAVADSSDPRNKRKRRAESSAVSSRHKNFKF